jgi:hypothetical protein
MNIGMALEIVQVKAGFAIDERGMSRGYARDTGYLKRIC